MTTKTHLPPVPAALADVALIDGPTCAASAGISLSSWQQEVRERKAPQPVIRQPRCTRWRLADVRAWLIERAEASDQQAAEAMVTRAKKASDEAKVKRRAWLDQQARAGDQQTEAA